MWIKTCDGEYINSDWITTIKTFGGNNTQILVGGMDRITTVSRTEDIREEIIKNIISGTPVMEVR